MVVIPSVPGRKYYEERNKKDVASSGDWNQSVDSMNKNLDSMNKGLDSVNEKLDSLNEDLDSFLNTLREINSYSKYAPKHGVDFKETKRKIMKDISIDVNSLDNAISLRCVREVLHRHILNNDEIINKLDNEYAFHLDTYSLGTYSIENAFFIKLIFKNIKKRNPNLPERSIVIDFEIEDLKNHEESKIIIDLDNNNFEYTGCAKEIFEEELNQSFDYDYIENHIYVDIDKMPLCIQEELYKIKKEQLKVEQGQQETEEETKLEKQENKQEFKKIKLHVNLKKLFSILNRNKKSKDLEEKSKKL